MVKVFTSILKVKGSNFTSSVWVVNNGKLSNILLSSSLK
jgi:hypothetical protein